MPTKRVGEKYPQVEFTPNDRKVHVRHPFGYDEPIPVSWAAFILGFTLGFLIASMLLVVIKSAP